jgi:TetR/AcrR family transcriptional regulator, transcriptional repressor for nem operon
VKVSEKKGAEHRAALVATARKLLQERGFDGAGVADISREAGLTQGALYSRFNSKDALAAEAVSQSLAESVALAQELREHTPDVLAAYLDAYVSDAHIKDVGAGCMIAACGSEVWRQNEAIGTAFAEGFRRLLETIQGAFPDGMPPKVARRRGIALLSAMAGSVAIARALKAADPGLSEEVIAAARKELEESALR